MLPRRSTLALALMLGIAPLLRGQTSVWNAGADMAANEAVTSTETQNPNALVPAWSYGYRLTLESNALTLLSSAAHFNSGTYPMEGFYDSVYIGVNVSASPLTNVNNGAGNLYPYLPLELATHPSASNDYAIVRWTAPASGDYLVTAFWRDLDPFDGDGASGHIVLNGIAIYNGVWANDGAAVNTGSLALSLAAGDTLDFATGSQGSFNGDSTAFNAVIVAVPEPSTIVLLGLGAVLGLAVRHARKSRRTA